MAQFSRAARAADTLQRARIQPLRIRPIRLDRSAAAATVHARRGDRRTAAVARSRGGRILYSRRPFRRRLHCVDSCSVRGAARPAWSHLRGGARVVRRRYRCGDYPCATGFRFGRTTRRTGSSPRTEHGRRILRLVRRMARSCVSRVGHQGGIAIDSRSGARDSRNRRPIRNAVAARRDTPTRWRWRDPRRSRPVWPHAAPRSSGCNAVRDDEIHREAP